MLALIIFTAHRRETYTMTREEVYSYVKETYETEPEYLWKKDPYSAVFRHKATKKWYGIVMNVNRRSLGMEEDGYVDVLNVKCETDMIGSLRMQDGVLPAFHMNKNNWISLFLDGSVAAGMIQNLLGISFEMTAGKKSGKRK